MSSFTSISPTDFIHLGVDVFLRRFHELGTIFDLHHPPAINSLSLGGDYWAAILLI
jgi:hypothetical protein